MVKIPGNNRGIMLVAILMVSAVLFIVAAAFVSSAIFQSQMAEREKGALQAQYAAETGIEYAFIESRNSGWNWITHKVDNTDPENLNLLVKNTATPVPAPSLFGASINATTGCYEVTTPLGTVEVKSYVTGTSGEPWVMSRANSGGIEKILRAKILRGSLFDFFFYYPYNKSFYGTVLNGQDAGGVHVNGNIWLSGVNFSHITELSTGANGTISVPRSTYNSPYALDDKVPGRDGQAPLPSLSAGHQYSDTNPYPWNDGRWPTLIGGYWPPYDWQSVDRHFSNPGKINTVNLPKQLSGDGSEWDWYKYDTGSQAKPSGEVPVQFYDANGVKAGTGALANYWTDLENWVLANPCGGNATCATNFFAADFWDGKTYKRPAANDVSVRVNYLNTEEQGGADGPWQAWLADDSPGGGASLKDVIKEKHTGSYDWSPRKIRDFASDAKTNGLYIGLDASNQLEVYHNGVHYTGAAAVLPAGTSDEKFANTLRPAIEGCFGGLCYPALLPDAEGADGLEQVLQIDINQLTPPDNGIIYIAHKNVRLVNAKVLPAGLTVVSPYNIYLKGNYNYDPAKSDAENNASWQPSAVITNSHIYILSDAFNDPDYLPVTVNPPEYPYEVAYVNLANLQDDPDKLQALEDQCKGFFGLSSSFELGDATTRPQNATELANRIRSQYKLEYEIGNTYGNDPMPNVAKDAVGNLITADNPMTIEVAVVSPYDLSISGGELQNQFLLERWPANSLKMEGAFVQWKGSWIDDAGGNPIRNNDSAWSQYKNQVYNFRRTGNEIYKIMQHVSCITGGFPAILFEYDARLGPATGGEKPPGDLVAGSQSLWGEVKDFNHHTPP